VEAELSTAVEQRLVEELDQAEKKAWQSLARYKFQMFGYWAAIWVHLNRISGAKRRNPWRHLVEDARQEAMPRDYVKAFDELVGTMSDEVPSPDEYR
jgi:hypothetical protein